MTGLDPMDYVPEFGAGPCRDGEAHVWPALGSCQCGRSGLRMYQDDTGTLVFTAEDPPAAHPEGRQE
jgi:hypothetical protein